MAGHAIRQVVKITLQLNDIADEDVARMVTVLRHFVLNITRHAEEQSDYRCDMSVHAIPQQATIRRAGSQVWRLYEEAGP